MAAEKSNLINYLFVMTKWRKFIIINSFILAVLTAIFSLCMPKTYTAHTTILGPKEEVRGLGFSSILSSLSLGDLGFGQVSEETYTFTAILNSRTIMETIAKQFNLMESYSADNLEETVRALRENVEVEINEDLTISFTASATTSFFPNDEDVDEARRLSRDMANTFIEELDKVNTKLKTEKAQNNRIFIEKRYLQNLADLKKSEEDLKNFQESYGVIALPEQMEVTIRAAAELKAQIVAKEIEVAVLSDYVSGSHSKLTKTKRELNELKKKFDEMKRGEKYELANNGTPDIRLFLPLNAAPELGLKYVRLYREVALQQKILEFLLPEYEQAKIQEAKDTPTVQVLDAAVTPIKRSKPKRTIMVLVAGFMGVLLSSIVAFAMEFVRNLEQNQTNDYRKLTEIGQNIRADFRKLLFRKPKS